MQHWLLTALLAFTPLSPSDVTAYVLTGWERAAQITQTNERVRQLATSLQADPAFRLVQAVDTDDDHLLDLIAVAAPPKEHEYRTGPVQLFRGADLQAGRFSPYLLTYGGTFRRIEQVADINGDGRTEIVISNGPYGSGANIDWLVYQWQGSTYRLLFDALVESWAGTNDLTISPGQITLTCTPMGVYDHHLYPHRQHREVWTWDGGAYHLSSHDAPPPTNQRQAVNDGEAHFRNQAYGKALPLYQRALGLPNQADDPDWAPYIHFRLGQTLALLGRREEGAKELGIASQAGGLLGLTAKATLAAWSHPLASALAAPLRLSPTEGTVMGGYFTPTLADLAPPEVLLQAYLQAGGEVARLLKAIPFAEAIQVDLDGDGRPEVWARMTANRYTPNGYLAVQSNGRWRVGELTDWGERPTVRPVPGTKRQVLHFWRPGEEPAEVTVGWDGKHLLVQPNWARFSEVQSYPLQRPAIPPCRGPASLLLLASGIRPNEGRPHPRLSE